MLRAALRPARPLLWVAVPALAVLLATLAVLARLAGDDPGLRLQRDLVAAGFQDVDVRLDEPGPTEPDAALVEVRYRSGLEPASRTRESDQALRVVWERYDGRLGSVRLRIDGAAMPPVSGADLERRFGPRPEGRSTAGYQGEVSRVRTIVVLAVVALLATFVLVFCAAAAAVLIVRRKTPRSPKLDSHALPGDKA